MLKKITALFCAIAMVIIPCGSVFAAETTEYTYEMKKAELAALGIEIPELLPKVTKETYIYALGKLLYDEPQKLYTAEELARQTGMLSAGMKYEANGAVTADEAVKFAVDALGYGALAEISGGYPNGYRKVAAEIKLTKGFTASRNEALNVSGAVELIYKMLEIEPMIQVADKSGNIKFEKQTGKTLLSLNRDIYKTEGLMTGNEFTSIYDESGAGECRAVIGGESYIAGGVETDEFLGKNVFAYVYDGGDYASEILYIGEKAGKNKELVINSEDIYKIADDFSTVRYTDEKGRLKSVKLTEALKVIYNGVYYSAYDTADLSPDVGSLRLVDNDGDEKYDVVFAEDYRTMLVNSVVGDEIYSGFDFNGALTSIDTYNKGDVKKCSVYKNGSEISIDDINVNDILSVAASKNAQVIKIFVSDVTFSGIIDSVEQDENRITVDGNVYNMSQDFLDVINSKSLELLPGGQFIFSTDAFGYLAYAVKTGEEEYCLLYKIVNNDEEYCVTYMNLDNVWQTAVVGENVRIDGVRYKYPEDAYQPIKDLGIQLVKMKKNSDGEIKKIETATQTSQSAEDAFTKTAVSTLYYRSGPQTFGNVIYLNSGAKALILPSNISCRDDIEVKSASSYVKGDNRYKVCAYDIDDFGFTDLIAITEDDSTIDSRRNNSMLVVTGISQTLTSDDEVMPMLAGNMGNLNVKLIGASSNVFDGIAKGDIINVSVNAKGRVENVKKVYSLTNSFSMISASDYYVSSCVIAGYVDKIDTAENKVRIECGTGTYMSFRLGSSTVVQTYDDAANECKTVSTAQLRKNDKIVCRISWGQISEIVVLRSE